MIKTELKEIKPEFVQWMSTRIDITEGGSMSLIKYGDASIAPGRYVTVLCPETFKAILVYGLVPVYRYASASAIGEVSISPIAVNLKEVPESNIWKIVTFEELHQAATFGKLAAGILRLRNFLFRNPEAQPTVG